MLHRSKALALLLALSGAMTNAYSAINYIADGRYIGVGDAGSPILQYKLSPPPYATFNQQVSWTSGGARQFSSLSSSQILSESVITYSSHTRAESVLSVTFNVDELSDFDLSGFLSFDDNIPTYMLFPDTGISVTLLQNGSPIFADAHNTLGMFAFGFTGQFSTGNTYQLIARASSGQYPRSYFDSQQYWRVSLAVHPVPVPEPAPAWLFAFGLLGLIGVAKIRRAKSARCP